MNAQQVGEFFEKMSQSPDLLKEFVALAARHGIDISDDQLSEVDLANVSGGTTGEDAARKELITQNRMQMIEEAFHTVSQTSKSGHQMSQDVISNLKA